MITALLAFLLTLALECPMLMILSRMNFRQVGPFCFAMNGFTWGTAMAILSLHPVPHTVLEAGITLTEAAILTQLRPWTFLQTTATSLLINLFSWLAGTFLLERIIGGS